MTIAEELEQKTLAFWKLSQVWNGHIERQVTTGDAIEICSIIAEMTSITRPLSYCNEALLDEIIKGEGNKTKHTKIIPFARPAKKRGANT